MRPQKKIIFNRDGKKFKDKDTKVTQIHPKGKIQMTPIKKLKDNGAARNQLQSLFLTLETMKEMQTHPHIR